MTNKEAKEILEWELNNFKYTDNEFVEATKVAIKALETGDRYDEGYAQGYVDGSTGADWSGDV